MQEFQIGMNEAGQRFDKFLHKYLKEANTGFLHKMLRKKNITLNKKKAEGKEILKLNDTVQFFFSDETFCKFRGSDRADTSQEFQINTGKEKISKNPANTKAEKKEKVEIAQYKKAYQSLKNIEVIFENAHILLLNKPAGVLSQKSMLQDLSLNEWLIGYLLEKRQITEEQLETYKPSICNRLDRNTSGIVICGKSLPGSQTMNRLIQQRRIRKFYRTFVKGKIEQESIIKGYLKKDEKTNKVVFKEKIEKAFEKEFQAIETAYKPLMVNDNYTYLEVELITGKTHQIRATLAGIGNPLLGDEKYGDRKWNLSFQNLQIPKWQLLHSYRIEFPKMEEVLEELSDRIFVAEEPEIYERLKENLER